MSTASMRRLLWRRAKSDWAIVMVTLTLVVFGLVMVYSVSRELTWIDPANTDRPEASFVSQARFAGLGLVGMLVISRIDYRYYKKYALWVGLATLALLMVGAAMRGRFLFTKDESVGETGRGQLTEAAKYGVVLYLAAWLSSAGKRLRSFGKGVLPAGAIVAIFCSLVALQQDLSTMILLATVCLIMIFVSGANVRHLSVLVIVAIAASVALMLLVAYREARLDTFFQNPLNDCNDSGYQTCRGLAALNRGGLFGQGLGNGIESRSLNYTAHTDYMFAMVGEQFGFLGAMLVIVLYTVWVRRGISISFRSVDSFGALVAIGVVGWGACRALLHIAVVTNTVPVTGTVLPYMSYGGSALVSDLAALGVLVSISRRATLAAENSA